MGKPRSTTRQCSVVGCHAHVEKRGWCNKHYQRWRSNGHPEKVRQIRGDHVARWWSKVDQTSGCWTWMGTIEDSGHGSFWDGSKEVGAHVYGYELIVGPIPPRTELDHVCRNRACVKPVHLEPVTHAVNVRRAIDGCRAGHPFVPGESFYIYPKSGSRLCVICHPERLPTPIDHPVMIEYLGARND